MSYCTDKLKMGYILTLKFNLALNIKVDFPQNNRNPNKGVLHVWLKFWWLQIEQVYCYHSEKQVINTHTETGNDNTRRPKLASGKNGKLYTHSHVLYIESGL